MPMIRKGHFRLNDDNTPVYLRGYINSDWGFIRPIELKTYDAEWTEQQWEFKVSLTRVAIVDKRVRGFWTGDQVKDAIRILRLAVHPDWQCRGIGSILLYDIEETYPTATTARMIVPEHQHKSFFVLRKNGYRPIKNLGPIFNVPGVWKKEDAYAFQKDLRIK